MRREPRRRQKSFVVHSSAVEGRRSVEERARVISRSSVALTDRLIAATPLASIYLWLAGIYVVEAWRRPTPWLFGDELEFTQLSRSIAANGHPAERGHPHGADSIYTYLIAPIWRIHNVATAYSAIKYVDVLIMAAVVFPTYLLARMIVGKVAAAFRGCRGGGDPIARVFVVPRRGAGRVSVRGALLLAHREGPRHAEAPLDRGSDRRICVRSRGPHRTRRPPRDPRARAPLRSLVERGE